MQTDRDRYDDGGEVPCRTCGTVLSHPSPVVYDLHLGAYHPSCRVMRKIRCDSTANEDPDGTVNVCSSVASFWNEANKLCYCGTHQEGLRGLQPISEMTKEIVAAVLAQQEKELG